MKNNIAKILLLSCIVVLFAFLIWFAFPISNNFTRITVVGDSYSKISPDTAIIKFSVVTQHKTALKAQQENARKSEAVKKAVESLLSRSKADIRTSNYVLEPERNYRYLKMPKIIGFEAKNSVIVSTSDLNKVGTVIDAATRAGANSIDGISFIVSNESKFHGNSLEKATKQAMIKAESIARSLNGKIVRIIETREIGDIGQPSADNADSFAANTSDWDYKTPIQTGKLNSYSKILLVVEVSI